MRKSLAVLISLAGVLGLFQNCSKFSSGQATGTSVLGSSGEVIDGISPNVVFTGGGKISVLGKNFGPQTSVTIGDQPCAEIALQNETEIICEVPPSATPAIRAVVVAGAVLPQELTYVEFSKMVTLAGRSGLRGIVDGVGRLARLDQATAMAIDGNTLYFAEGVLNAIRALDLETNEVKLYAGVRDQDGAFVDGGVADARFSGIRAMTVSKGVLYVAEFDNCAIRAIDLATKKVTTLLGGPGAGCVPADGPFETATIGKVTALAAQGGLLFIGERLSSSAGIIRKIDLTSRTVTRVAGALAPSPPSLTSAWVPAVSALDQERVLTTPVETPHPYSSSDTTSATFAQAGAKAMRLHFTRVQADAGDSFSISGTNDAITYVDVEGANLTDYWTPVISDASVDLNLVNYGTGYGFRLDKVQYTTSGDGPRVHTYDGPALSATIVSASDLVAKGDQLYFIDDSLHVVRKVDLKTGALTALFGKFDDGTPKIASFSETTLSAASGLALDGGNLYVSDMNRDRILRYDLATRGLSVAAWADPTAGAALNIDGALTGAGLLTPMDLIYDGRRGLLFSVGTMIRRLK